MTTYEIKELERILEEHDIDCDTRMEIVEAALSHKNLQAVLKFENLLNKLPVVSLKLPS